MLENLQNPNEIAWNEKWYKGSQGEWIRLEDKEGGEGKKEYGNPRKGSK